MGDAQAAPVTRTYDRRRDKTRITTICHAVRQIAALALTFAIAIMLLTGCFSGGIESTGDEPYGADRPDPYEEAPRERTMEAEYSQEATFEADQDRYEETMYEEMEQERADEEAERRKDAIRQCILEGAEPALCQLDPSDPYGVMDQP